MQINAVNFAIIMLCAFVSGALGAAVFCLLASRLKHRTAKQSKVQSDSNASASGWGRLSRDEQLYNGR